MPFNPHRSMIPARRYPMPQPPPLLQTMQQQQRPMFQRAASYDPYTVSREPVNSTRATPQPQNHQSYTPITASHGQFYPNNATPTQDMQYTPLIADMDSAYFSKCATPESTLAPDMWDDGTFTNLQRFMLRAEYHVSHEIWQQQQQQHRQDSEHG